MRKLLALIMICGLLAPVISAAEDQSVALTVYNDNFAVVREDRMMEFSAGTNTKKFTDVASAIDPASVNFKCLSAPGKVTILEQNYEYDLVSTSALLKRYIDKEVVIAIKGSGADPGTRFKATLSAARDQNLILDGGEAGIRVVDRSSVEEIRLEKLPEGLVTKPTLMWLVKADEAGVQKCRVTYTTDSINWDANYSAVLDSSEKTMDFGGWVTINNRSGKTYRDARLKLVAGNVRRIRRRRPAVKEMEMTLGRGRAASAFEEKPFMEYHLYTLERKSTIANNQIKQIEFITPAEDVSVEKVYKYQRQQQPEKVQVHIEFQNSERAGLGIALPAGKIRVFKKDPADQMLEFVGEDTIDHTPPGEELSLYIGNAFDITAEHTLLDSSQQRRRRTETHEVEFHNRKNQAVTILAEEKFPARVNWQIEDSSHEYEKTDANTATFKVKAGPDAEVTLKYKTTQWW